MCRYAAKKKNGLFNYNHMMVWGYVVAQLVEALWYKPEGHVFDS
jgi:hypothetical protein